MYTHTTQAIQRLRNQELCRLRHHLQCSSSQRLFSTSRMTPPPPPPPGFKAPGLGVMPPTSAPTTNTQAAGYTPMPPTSGPTGQLRPPPPPPGAPLHLRTPGMASSAPSATMVRPPGVHLPPPPPVGTFGMARPPGAPGAPPPSPFPSNFTRPPTPAQAFAPKPAGVPPMPPPIPGIPRPPMPGFSNLPPPPTVPPIPGIPPIPPLPNMSGTPPPAPAASATSPSSTMPPPPLPPNPFSSAKLTPGLGSNVARPASPLGQGPSASFASPFTLPSFASLGTPPGAPPLNASPQMPSLANLKAPTFNNFAQKTLRPATGDSPVVPGLPGNFPGKPADLGGLKVAPGSFGRPSTPGNSQFSDLLDSLTKQTNTMRTQSNTLLNGFQAGNKTDSIAELVTTWQKKASERVLDAFDKAIAQKEVTPEELELQQEEERRLEEERALIRKMKQMELENVKKVPIKHIQSVNELALRAKRSPKKMLAVLRQLDDVPRTSLSLIDAQMAELVLAEMGLEADYASFDAAGKSEKFIQADSDIARAPVVCIMGHVDHGKTTLLDAFRQSNVVAGEAGRITQSIGGFSIPVPDSLIDFIPSVTFLDTPGHAIFRSMRQRGVQRGLTDIAIIVLAATDGVQPQTREAVKLAQEAGLPMIVAVTKVDVDGASPKKVLEQLYVELDVKTEPMGGDVVAVEVCAPKGEGIDAVLEAIAIIAQEQKLSYKSRMTFTNEDVENWNSYTRAIAKGETASAVYTRKHKHNGEDIVEEVPFTDVTDLTLGYAYVVESFMSRGAGAALNVVVRQGEMRVGDHVICGTEVGTIRAILDDQGRSIEVAKAEHSLPVQVLGINPESLEHMGEDLVVLPSVELAKALSERRCKERDALVFMEQSTVEDSTVQVKSQVKRVKLKHHRYATALQVRGSAAETEALQAEEDRLFYVYIKADVKGSLEAIQAYIEDLSFSKHAEFAEVRVIKVSLGNEISEHDIDFAKNRGNVCIFGFNTKVSNKVQAYATENEITVHSHDVIFHLFDSFRAELSKKMPKMPRDQVHGVAVLQQMFPLSMSKIGIKRMCQEASYALSGEPVAIEGAPTVCGSRVISGEIIRGLAPQVDHSLVKWRARRDNEIVKDDMICISIRHFKDQVSKLEKGKECGILLNNVEDLAEGDTLECYQTVMEHMLYDDSMARGQKVDKPDWMQFQ